MGNEMTTTSGRGAAGGIEATRPRPVFAPRTDIYETDGLVVVVADMPGVGPDDVQVTLERRVLSIRGRGRSDAHSGYRRLHAEYGEGDFERVFTISEEIDRDAIEASLKNGVLTLRLPKAEAAKTRRIAVRAN